MFFRPSREKPLKAVGTVVNPTMPPSAWAKRGLVELCMLQVELIPDGELEHAVVPVAPP